jgi:uncharacterized protein (DUF58 family)
VFVALSGVLLLASLNRQDPMLYGMFIMLSVVGALGYLLPWLSLRSVTLEHAGAWPEELEVVQDQPLDLDLRVRQLGWWPAWMVEVEARWEWASHEFTSSSTVAYLGPRGQAGALDAVSFGCRGHYRLVEFSLCSGFPLGLIHARRSVEVGRFSVLVRPADWPMRLPSTWTVSEDTRGDAAEGHAGESLELNMLRAYEPGEAVRRVDWRASARAGELVVRQFQHPASVLVKLLVDPPGAQEVGRPDSASEQALRVASSVLTQLEQEGVRFALLMPDAPAAVQAQTARRALAVATPATGAWSARLMIAASGLRRGEQLVVVLAATASAQPVVGAAHEALAKGARLVVVIATWPGAPGALNELAAKLQVELKVANVEAWLACH